ncbi:MAG: hypothetical protein WBA31_01155 [Candidatus Dormiibacterota bacterium]
MKNAPSRPLIAELVDPAPRQLTGARVATLLLAAAPIAARLGWWWWNQARRRPLPTSSTASALPAAIERTEIEMVQRTLGRWRLRVTSTRWQVPTVTATPRESPVRLRTAWLGPTVRLTRAALAANSRQAASQVPRLPASSARPRA